MDKKPAIHLTHKAPVTAFQGLNVNIGSDGSITMHFYQNTAESAELIEGDVVAAVHVPDRARWEQIKALVEQQLNIFEKREP